ncbi:MAG: M67 family metallopeptidase [Candidatus Tectomicrobia bacterium]|uniref:M67 family metallopeptidase n=1 Tax=Tectimicrobiota bacterium TaxID=2528274 RepID=A0A933GNM6_UNCTE|nr:M67 family metallopeptidase [Candidatus Tectomicrobia bacterium]
MERRIFIKTSLIDTFRTLSQESYPHECCGFLAGPLSTAGPKEIQRFKASKNINLQRATDRYEIDPREYLRFEKECLASREEIIGFFHSHPDHRPLPSDFDRNMAWPGYSYVIISVCGGKAGEIRCWTLEEEKRLFLEERIRII